MERVKEKKRKDEMPKCQNVAMIFWCDWAVAMVLLR